MSERQRTPVTDDGAWDLGAGEVTLEREGAQRGAAQVARADPGRDPEAAFGAPDPLEEIVVLGAEQRFVKTADLLQELAPECA